MIEKIKETFKKNALLWVIRGILTAVLILFMSLSWPGFTFHNHYLSKTLSEECVTTEVLWNHIMATQYFIPQLPHLESIQIAAEYNEELKDHDFMTFLLCDESGKILVNKDYMLQEVSNGSYFEIPVNKKLKPGKTYYWSLVSPEDEKCQWRVMYTEYLERQAPENSLFLVGENGYGGENAQTVSQYNYKIHLDKSVILAGYWLTAVLVYIVCLEMANRFFDKKKQYGKKLQS